MSPYPERETPGTMLAAKALRAQGEWVYATLMSIGDAIITTDHQGQVTFLNPGAQRLTGWTPADAVGLPLESVFQIVHEETRQAIEHPAISALREGLSSELTHRALLIAQDGTERPVEVSTTPMHQAPGESAGVVLVFREAAARPTVEPLEQHTHASAENIMATLREPLLVLNKNLRVKMANRAFCETFQVTKEETENRLLYELGERQWDIPELRTLLEAILPEKRSMRDFEVARTFPHLGYRIMCLNACPVYDEGDGLELILLTLEDSTADKQAKAALAASELRYRRLFEAAKDGILILHAETGKIIDANPYINTLLGYTFEEMIGKQLWEIGLFKDIEANRVAYQTLKEKGYIRYAHLPLETKSGLNVEVEFVSNIYQMDHEQVIQCNIRDITGRRQLERKTQVQSEELADLHRRKDEFLAMLSHELRNPLAAIFNALHLLSLQDTESLSQRHARTIIERQVKQLSQIVNDLLEVSRITTGRVRLQLERADIRSIIEHAIETSRPVIDQRRHQLSVSLPPEPIWIYADPTRLEQIMINLLTNAAKYTDTGGQIWVAAHQEEDEVVLRVRDNGVGIAPELLPRIFNLFQQADRTLDRAEGGLGIGLSLAKGLAQLHQGTIQALSAGLGRGSEFIVRLPIMTPPAKPQPPTIENIKHPEPTKSPVLVVDDNVDVADTIAILLRMFGHRVEVAYSSQAALDKAVIFQPQFVLLDIGLPVMDGYEVARRLRQAPQTKKTWLIAMTGYGQDTDRESSQQAGFDHHMIKPVDPQELQQLLSQLTAQARPAS